MHLTILDRIRRFFSTEVPGFPSPPSEAPGVRVFYAWRLWKSNVCGTVVVGIGAIAIFTFIGGTMLWQSRDWDQRLWGAAIILFAIAGMLALFAGNVAAIQPYAVEIVENRGFYFYAPFKKFYIPTEEVKSIHWSWLCAGWFVRLRQRRGLLPGFIIHVAWGPVGRELSHAIEEELAREQ